jgi:ribosomal-protein-alanine N-acetyltransferase
VFRLKVRITRFRLRHLPRILELEGEVFPDDAYPREMFLDLYAGCGELFLVAHSGGKVVGYSVACASKRKAELVSIAVDPGSRGQGIGTALLARTVSGLRERGITTLELAVRAGNRSAIEFYRWRGFQPAGRTLGYYEDGADALRMRLRLAPEQPVQAERPRAGKR